MKVKFLLMFAVVAMFAASVVGQTVTVPNGNMETWDGSDTIPTGYKRSGSSTVVQMTQAAGRGGSGYATRFQCADSVGTGSNRFWSPAFSLNKAGIYEVSFWVKGNATIGIARVVPDSTSANNGKALTGLDGKLEGTTVSVGDWTQYKAEFPYFVYNNKKTYYICLVFNKATNSSPDVDILLDDISVEFKSSDFFQNGDMETWTNTNLPTIPDNYAMGNKTVDANSYFSKVAGRNGSANALRIQKPYTTSNASDRIFSPYVLTTSLDTAKVHRLSLWVKGTGRIQYMFVLASQSSVNGIRQDLTTSSSGINFDYADWTEISYVFKPNQPGYRNIMFIICGRSSGEISDVYLDDISIVEEVPVASDATLKNISIPDPLNVTDVAYDYILPGFAPENDQYTVYLWFGADTVPDLRITTNASTATYVIDNEGSNAFLAGAKTKTVTIKVTSADLTTEESYYVTFNRENYVAGFFRVLSTINSVNNTTLAQFSDIKGLFGPSSFPTASPPHNDYWGYSAIRPQSTPTNAEGRAYLVTKPLVNGAGKITFWTGNRSAAYSDPIALDSMYLKLSVTIDGNWTDLKEWQVDTTALHGKWTKMEYDINNVDPNTQVKLEYRKGTDVTKFLPIDIDDIFITPYDGTSLPGVKYKGSSLNIYPQGQAIVVEEEGKYAIYTVSGQLIASGNNTGQIITIPVKSGLYIAKSGNQAKKLVVK